MEFNFQKRPIRIYNTLSQSKEIFYPIASPNVSMFVCGPTVYDYSHIGHAKTYTQFDFIARYLRLKGFNVYYLQNITNIDDKIISRSNEKGVAWKELTEDFEEKYLEDMRSLHNFSVTKYARATDYVPQIICQVRKLMEKGFAYRTEDGIYFEISKFPEYGKLARRTQTEESDARSRIDDSREKKGWNDFCLWKFKRENEPYWESELGQGRPGWHIEDTAISESHFGEQYDIHGGAVDLIFPHHEAEIAQMESISGKSPFVKYWLHTGFLNTKLIKMSKSLGNFLTIREALTKYNFRILRFFFLSAHYKKPLELSHKSLEKAKHSLDRIDEYISSIDPNLEDIKFEDIINKYRNKLYLFLDDDFNTPRAIATLYDFIRELNTLDGAGHYVHAFFHELNTIFDFFDLKEKVTDSEILTQIKQREHYRNNGDFEKADEIRAQLLKLGVQLYDTKNGAKWRIKSN